MNDLVFGAINGLAGLSPLFDAVGRFAAGPLIYLLFAAGGVSLLLAMRGRTRTDNLWMVGQVGAALALGFLVNRVLRWMELSRRPFESRPVVQLVQHEPGVSFPSNHATAAVTVALVVGVFVSATWGLALGVPAALVALSRVFVGVHWPADILCGAVVGLVATLLVRWAARLLRDRFPRSGGGGVEAPRLVSAPRAEVDAETVVLVRDPDQTVVLPRVR
ncbi:phosphatase PAP2 family protein [Streptoalloteichus hindustanus]|uniref:Undecaprenyl-diphosphatase n=1 Tax=Streptoalloteichus hindustanus TaxID=2017 RepID=A0A1M4UL39_STRHI|nr:phosphatase PAP2 family protein [Streptoalloteichus hindustanus]SHE57482.1 Undecaprenyl-diphosphatase [Streptoalloteichus hindustanus]